MIWLLLSLPSALSLSAICFGELRLNLPVRYLHIQLVEDGHNLTESRGPIAFSLDLPSNDYVANVLDRGDGMYIFRLQLTGSQPRFVVRLSWNAEDICGGPLTILGHDERYLTAENCDCPIPMKNWLKQADCPLEPWIEQDLERFPIIDFPGVLNTSRELWAQAEHSRTYSWCHYQIFNNRAYRSCYGEYVGFRSFLDNTLASLLRKMAMPNTEFLFNLGDYPLSLPQDNVPMISWCGSGSTLDLVLPTYTFSGQVFDYGMNEPNMHFSGDPIPWSQKLDRAVFRGRDSDQLRLHLARLSEEDPGGIVDAGITAYFFFSEAEHSPRKERMRFEDFFKYKYVLSVDGTVAAYRFPTLLAGSSVIFKSDSEYYEHFYRDLEPYVHYIPFNRENILDRLEWAGKRDHNETLKAQRQFVLDHLQPKNFFCYLSRFFESYTKRLRSAPTFLADGMSPADGLFVKCNCDKRGRNEEL